MSSPLAPLSSSLRDQEVAIVNRLRGDLQLPETLADITTSPRQVIVKKLPEIQEWAEKQNRNIWDLHSAVNVRPHRYVKQDSGQTYRKSNVRELARVIWKPDDDKEALVKRLKNELRQSKVPTNLSNFFHGAKLSAWLKRNNFHDLPQFSKYFDIDMKLSRGGKRKQFSIDYENLVSEIWPAESVPKLFKMIKKQNPERPVNLQEFFVAGNKRLMTCLAKNGFSSLRDFFRYVGVVNEDTSVDEDSGTVKEPVIDFQSLGRGIWVKPAKETIAELVKTSVQEYRPSNLIKFFRSDGFKDLLASNGFVNLTDFSRHLGMEIKIVKFQGSPKVNIDYDFLADFIWAKQDRKELTKKLYDDLGQRLRPKKPQPFFLSDQFKTWLTENNFESVLAFAQHFGAKISKKKVIDNARGKPRTKVESYIDYDSLARKVWKTPILRIIRSEMQGLRQDFALTGLQSPYRFFKSSQLKEWLSVNNFRDLVHFCEVIKVPTERREATDRNTGKVAYDWDAMLEKLGCDG